MPGPERILVFGESVDPADPLIERLRTECDVVVPENLEAGLREMHAGDVAGILLLGPGVSTPGILLEAAGILEQMPDALVLLDPDLRIVWASARLRELTAEGRDDQIDTAAAALAGMNFYDAFGTPEIIGPDFCPFHTALGSGEASKSTLRVGERFYYEVHAKPVFENDPDVPEFLVVIVRDVSIEVLQRQKLNAIYQAGLELGDLSPEEVLDMTVQQRVELLKSKVLHYTKDLLEFETVEIRLVDKKTKRLEPLLAVGMQPTAANRELWAEPQNNGVTGFVAATGKSYLCEDTENDPLYLPGAAGARSSLTVPLVLHDEILGTFNVESPKPGAFDEQDLQFLELFSREVAVALNTLELLVAEKMTTATESSELILREVARPVDEILNDAAWILERYIGHEPNVSERLQRILKHTRNIRQLIHKVGEEIVPKVAHSPLPSRPERPKLRHKRILVVDSDASVRDAAHELLGRYGCEVETAHNGEEALLMVRSFSYDAVIADIRLPDMTGYECFRQLREIREDLSVILMTGFGYDPTHSIVKARQEGLKAVLYKPFRLDQLLGELEKAVSSSDLAESSR
ncbi:MAG: response regulator [Planctomycetaceae bacterium]